MGYITTPIVNMIQGFLHFELWIFTLYFVAICHIKGISIDIHIIYSSMGKT